MDLKPTVTLRSMMLSGAIIFGAFAGAKLYKRDLDNGLWSFAVCFALVLGILPPWLTGHSAASEVKPEKYNLMS